MNPHPEILTLGVEHRVEGLAMTKRIWKFATKIFSRILWIMNLKFELVKKNQTCLCYLGAKLFLPWCLKKKLFQLSKISPDLNLKIHSDGALINLNNGLFLFLSFLKCLIRAMDANLHKGKPCSYRASRLPRRKRYFGSCLISSLEMYAIPAKRTDRATI